MQHQHGSFRRVIYALILAAMVALAGFSLVGTALAEVVQNNRAFLPLVIKADPNGTIPPP
jgi:hypothetical protein